jgi:hypothetical protein
MRHLQPLMLAALGIAMCGCGADAPTVPTPGVTRILVAGTAPALGESSQFTAIAIKTDGSDLAVTSEARWQSSNPSIATVDSRGVVTARSIGPVEIIATFSGITGSLTATVGATVTFTLAGVITDVTTQQGVTSATISVRDVKGAHVSTTTDSTGAYRVAGLSEGSAEITASAVDHVTVTRTVTITGNMMLNISLPRASACPSIGFDTLQPHGASFTSHARCGINVRATTSNWTISTGYGRPAPFIQFNSSAGMTSSGEVIVTAAGASFKFRSVDVYSSTTTIPYVITGIANSSTVFTIHATQGNTFGNFATVNNPQPATVVDTLVIRLTNPAAPCCGNPVGLDNIVLAY